MTRRLDVFKQSVARRKCLSAFVTGQGFCWVNAIGSHSSFDLASALIKLQHFYYYHLTASFPGQPG